MRQTPAGRPAGEAWAERCRGCGGTLAHSPTCPTQLLDLLNDLTEWGISVAGVGGWEAPVWERVRTTRQALRDELKRRILR